MHIPDGYLSPSTCAALYAGAMPFWYVALQRLKKQLHTRLVPLLSLFSAFSFVVMMFNLPLPGGTTGHAIGVALAAIVLGPWAAILAISVALLIQALFFADGGITALGANCFNMAVVGAGLAYAVYRAVAGRSPLDSRRRVWAAGLAGYVAVNGAALLTAVQFGIQPLYFSDANGTPLYCPYPLSVAIPAMMVPHLLVPGLAEAFVTAGVVKYIQGFDASLLQGTAPGAIQHGAPAVPTSAQAPAATGWRSARRLWAGLGLMMLLSPLGLLASGTAWGEWAPEDFRDEAERQSIAAASLQHATPAEPPRGMERLSKLWEAPVPDYAPAFIPHEGTGYILSAVAGTGLIILFCVGGSWLVGLRRSRGPAV